MEKKTKPLENFKPLPRGGYLVETSIGGIQFGSPPETIKDTMLMPGNVPLVYVLSAEMFNWKKGISVAEIEFPLYYNFFIRKKKTNVICTEEQYAKMKKVLQESLFGPRKFDISKDFEKIQPSVPDIKKEMNFFRNNLKFSDLVNFGIFRKGVFDIQGITIHINSAGNYEVYDGKSCIAVVPGRVEYKPTYQIGQRLSEPYTPPLFGVTCLGPSHGFDPEENTSGFIIWLNHQGIMVDPPVNSTEWLEDSNVNPKLIDSIILTHCHADHDAGTFQKILEEGKITIYSTETVMMSFLRKYSALSDVDVQYLMKLFNFHPVKIGTPVYINGGEFRMFYTLHSIPTMGFKMSFQDQTFVYSSDHNNDPETHGKLLETGTITRERYDELRNFPWDSKVIYHESGVPPLHTPIRYLDSLPDEIRGKTVIYHIAKKDFPRETVLTLARFGIENTLYFETKSPRFESAFRILSVFKHLDFFTDIPIEKAQEFIEIVEEERFKKGEVIIRKGGQGDKFYIIYSGNVSIDSGGLEQNKIYGAYDTFGEVALVTDQTRVADVIAETDVILFTIERYKFLNFIIGTDFEKTLKRLAKIRSSETWNLLAMNPLMQYCTSSQKTWLESILIPVDKLKSGKLIREGGDIDFIYLIRAGEVDVKKSGKRVALLKKGDFIGSLQNVHRGEKSGYTYSHDGPVSLFAMRAEDILQFVNRYPGLLMKLVYRF
ncbi:MAG: cAMP/cGMP-dependent 3',5'-cyclic-AMP/GMP phosphodiesterase [Spirochaetes bacterium]|jgi:CRP-like cAMP-binding protein|nr:cAMP/cGMP-dependent 3',5'-cyclic-AMP/GMP phosphodiesterase [Spirochaetota bacterium]